MAAELPELFIKNMKELLGGEYEAFWESGQSAGFRGLRVNTSKIEAEKFEEISPFPLKRVPWISNGFYLETHTQASAHPYYAAGLYYLQEPSAMTPAACLPVEEGDRVLDLCAAPGGKATELAARLKGTGLLVANDISSSRAKGLLKNLELFGAGNILVTSERPERLASYFTGFFDKILIDAPCSGEGMFRKDSSMVRDWTEHGPDWYASVQRELIEQAAGMLRPGGMLLYSTCTFSPQENEGTIAHLLKKDSSFRMCRLPDYKGFSSGRPDCLSEEAKGLSGDIFQQKAAKSFASKKNAAVCPEWEQFAKELGISIPPESLRLYDGKLYSLPKDLWNRSIRGLRFLRTGLYLGEAAKKRFTPSQALAMALGKDTCNAWVDFPSSDSRVIRYLKGESPELTESDPASREAGWCLVCADGFSLGWGKLVNGQLRNKYYPGWRWQHAVG